MSELRKNDRIMGVIDGYTAEGMGVLRHEGMAVFVPGTARGDRCAVRAVKVLKNRAYGRVEEVLEPSPHRIAPRCPAFPRCGGCDFQHLSYEEELWLKRRRVEDALRRLGGFAPEVPPVVPAPQIDGYRNKAVFPFGRVNGRAVCGFYRSRSHDIVPVQSCLIQDPRACALAGAVCRWADENGISEYDEKTGKGFLRSVFVRAGEQGSQLCLIARTERVPAVERLAAHCRAACPDVTGILVSPNPDKTNRLMGRTARVLWGEERLRDRLGKWEFALSPLSFYQVNHAQAEALYREAVQMAGLDKSQTALDLFCGIGTITLHLAEQAGQAVGAEIVPQAVEDARQNAARAGLENVRFLCGDAGRAAGELAAEGLRPDVVVLDPPRKGIDRATVDAVLKMKPARVVYIACDCASLARDGALLRDEGGYQLTRVRAFDMFPRTANVETAALLERAAEGNA